MLSCRDLRCFDAKSILTRFTHFCVEQKITNKSCPWSTNDKYDVCSYYLVVWFDASGSREGGSLVAPPSPVDNEDACNKENMMIMKYKR